MIQRRQTLYLLAAVACAAALLLLPLATAETTVRSAETLAVDGTIERTTVVAQSSLCLSAFGLSADGVPLLRFPYFIALIAITLLACVGAVLAFRYATLQLRLAYAALALSAGVAVFVCLLWYRFSAACESFAAAPSPTLWAALPLPLIAFLLLAVRAIRSDVALLRDAARLR